MECGSPAAALTPASSPQCQAGARAPAPKIIASSFCHPEGRDARRGPKDLNVAGIRPLRNPLPLLSLLTNRYVCARARIGVSFASDSFVGCGSPAAALPAPAPKITTRQHLSF